MVFALIGMANSSVVRAEDQERTMDRMMDPEIHETDSPEPSSSSDEPNLIMGNEMKNMMGDENGNSDKGNTAGRLEKIRERVQNLEQVFALRNDTDEIQKMATEQAQIQERLQTALNKVQERPAYLRFLIGADYKNVGVARAEIVKLQSQIQQLTRLKDKLTNQTDKEEVQGIINDLQTQLDETQSTIQQETQGFSLFGWLAKLFTNTTTTQ